MIREIYLSVFLLLAAVVVSWAKNMVRRNKSRRHLNFGCMACLIAIFVSFFLVQSGIVQRTVYSVFVVFLSVVYFSIQFYQLAKKSP